MSIAFVSSGKTAEIFRSDSTQHSGPRTDYNANGRQKCALRFYQEAAVPVNASQLVKQMVESIDGNIQKLTSSYNEVKGLDSNARSIRDAAQEVYDSAKNDFDTKKSEMEQALGQATSTANQCTANSNTLVAATTVLSDATKARDDGKSVIDRELAVIQQLKQKLQEVFSPASRFLFY
jgi:dsDNA-specific endonuclease/ATPase MutS2